jgi:DNA-binding response OmpR family regulator
MSPIAPAQRSDDHAIKSGPFVLLPHTRELHIDGRITELGGRAFDLLMLLISSRGRIVTKKEIFNRVWPSVFISESNLRVQIATLRRMLGDYGYLIKNIPGRGYIFLDKDVIDAAIALARTAARPSTIPDTTGGLPTVGVIDDDEDVRDAIASLLRSSGMGVELFASGNEYLERHASSRCRCLILDVLLPGQNGLEFQEVLARRNIRLPIIFISGHGDISMTVRAMKTGAVDFLTKPIRPEALLSAIRLALRAA